MQNKTLLAIVAVAAVILLGAGGIFLFSKNKTASTPNNTVAKTAAPKEMSGGSLKDIFSNGGNKMCTFDVKSENGGETIGTIYNSGKNAYGEIQIKTSSKTQKTYVIRDSETFYMWGDSFPTGIKMTLSLDEMESKLTGNQGAQVTSAPSPKTEFKCSDWAVDSSKFTPPSNIKFTDMSSVMKEAGVSAAPTNGTGNPSQCSICTSLTGAAKTACLTQFNCK